MADAYLKVKDNGANGLAIVREESDVSVTDLKSAFFNKTFKIEKLDTGIGVFVDGQTGNSSGANGWFSSDYIFVPCKNIKVKCSFLGKGGLAFYDINKTYISGINENNASNYGFTRGTMERTINVPDNAFFIKFSVFKQHSTSGYIAGELDAAELINQLSNARVLNS